MIPEDKKEKPKDARALSMPVPGGNSEDIVIEGIDTARGIFMTGGTREKYIRMLGVFRKDSLKKLDEIRASIRDKNLSLFTIYVHGLKNACAIVGADELSKASESLERAGIQNNSKLIYSTVDSFLDKLQTLVDNIDNALSTEGMAERKEAIDAASLRVCLVALRKALMDFDSSTIHELTGKLQKVSYDAVTDVVLGEIMHQQLIGEYDEAITQIDALLAGLRIPNSSTH